MTAPRKNRQARGRSTPFPPAAAHFLFSSAFVALAILISSFSGTVWAQGASAAKQAEISFSFENPQVHPIRYSLRVAEDGSGEYTSVAGGALPGDGNDSIVSPGQSRPIAIGEALRAKLFLLARRNKFFALPCQAHRKVAFNGTKTLSYSGPDGQGSCTYTWSKYQDIETLTQIFQGIALTLDEGGKLAVERAHAPLALDAELILLTKLVKQGEVLELQNIAPVLTAIANDDAALKRDRQWARELLAPGKSRSSLSADRLE